MAMFLSGVPQLGFAPTLPVISPMTTRPAAVMSAADKLCAAHTKNTSTAHLCLAELAL